MIDLPATERRPASDQMAFTTSSACPDRRAIRLGRCEVLPWARALSREGRRVDIGSRAFDLLMVLLHSRGAIVTKEQILRTVWPTTIVEESNLRFQMAALRCALGEDRDLIKTVPGRGYLLIEGNEPAHVAPPTLPDLKVSEQKSTHNRENSIVLIVEQDSELRKALLEYLRPFQARLLFVRANDALRPNAAETS